MEQATSGQMGQPAACMIENNGTLRADEMLRDYGPHSEGFLRITELARQSFQVRRSPTECVDNFVNNWVGIRRQPAPVRACDKSMTNWAAKTQMKSTLFNAFPCVSRGFWVNSAILFSLWSIPTGKAVPGRGCIDV